MEHFLIFYDVINYEAMVGVSIRDG